MKRIAFIFTILFISASATAQGHFDFSAFVGGNLSQIDGDDAGHYNHIGVRAGIGTSYPFGGDDHSPWRYAVEIAYTNKGSNISATDGQIDLHYIEVPLLIKYTYTKFTALAGIAPAVNVGTTVTFSGVRSQPHEATYRKMDLCPITVGVRYALTNNIGLDFRWQNSIISVTTGTSNGTYRIIRSNKGSFNRLITACIVYQF